MSTNATAVSATAAIDASPSAANRVSRAISVTQTQPSTPPDGCYRCHQEIYLSFFFDGFGHSLQDGDRLSNVGRLYLAHRATDKSSGIYRLYYEGMGKDLSKETVGIAGTLAKKTIDKGKEAIVDKLKDSVKDARKEAGKDAVKEAMENTPKVGVKSAAKSAILHSVEKFQAGLKPGAVLGNLKKALTDPQFLASQATSIVADTFPLIRDSEISAGYLGTGFDARVEKAIKDFAQIILQAKKDDQRPIKTIRIAIFGYDRGAVIARKFANELIEKTCKKKDEKITYEDAEVQFDFMGLFDSVSSAYADSIFTKVLAPVLTFTPAAEAGWGIKIGMKAISFVVGLAKRSLGEYDTPGEFRKVVHHVAAMELRFYKQLDSPRNSKEAGNLTEVAYPGSQSDVGGGFAEGEDGKSAELARVSALNMLDQAWACGVPLRTLQVLRQSKQLDVLGELEFNKKVSVNGRDLTANELFRAYAALLPAGKGTLEHQFLAHQKLFVSWARTVHDRTHAVSTGSNLFINTVDAEVYNAIFTGDATPDFDARADYYKVVSAGKVPVSLDGQRRSAADITDATIKELATAWVKPAALSPEVIAFFDNFVHNTITRLNNVSLGDGVFLQLRAIEDKSRKDQLTDKAKDATKKATKKVLPDPDQIREDALQELKDAGTWSQGSQRYPDPLGLGSPGADFSSLTNLVKE